MRIVKEGEQKKAFCPGCGKITGTYVLRDFPINNNENIVKNILALACNNCNATIASPAQSTPHIYAEIRVKHSVEVRVPAHFIDILYMAVNQIDKDLDENFYKTIIMYYIDEIHSGHIPYNSLKSLLEQDIAEAKSSKRVSLKINVKQHTAINDIIAKNESSNQSELIKAIILRIYFDILVTKDKKVINKLKKIGQYF